MPIIVCLNNDLRLALIYFRQNHIFSLIFLNGGKCVNSYIKEIVFKGIGLQRLSLSSEDGSWRD